MGGGQIPSVGRIVHYISREGEEIAKGGVHMAAIIVGVNEEIGKISLRVFSSEGHDFFFDSVVYDEEQKQGTWHWPERV